MSDLTKGILEPLDEDELTRLDAFLLDRLDDEAGDRIAEAGGDEGIIDISELDGLLTALVSGPDVIPPSRWLRVVWGAEEPAWESARQFQDIFTLIIRHQNSIAATLLHEPGAFEPLFGERHVKGKNFLIVDEWCHGYMRGVALDEQAWRIGGTQIENLVRPIRLWGTEEGWRAIEAMSDADQDRERAAIAPAVRALYQYWLERRVPEAVSDRRAAPKVGRNDPCPCGSGKKYKHCCLQ